MNLELNTALGNQTYFYQKFGSGTQKSNETRNLKNWIKIKKKTFVIEKFQMGKWWDQNLCIFKISGFMTIA